tara:strand:+ start:7321 stop:9564 length:2244 start_codon:yes stop_codon:yes gene_type:complete
MAVLEFTNAVVGNNDWSNVGNWIDVSTGSPPSSLGAGDTYYVVIGGLLSQPINLNATNLGHLFLSTSGAAINVSLASYNAKSIIFDNKFGGCPLNLTQSATVIAMDGTHSAAGVSPNYGYSIQLNGSLSSTSVNGIETLEFTLGGSTDHHLPSSGQLDCQVTVLSGSQASMMPSGAESQIWANTYSVGGSPTPISNTQRQHNSLRLHSLNLPTNSAIPTQGGNQQVGMHNGEGVEFDQYVLEVGRGNTTNCGIVSTNNPILNFMGIKLIFLIDSDGLTLPCDNYIVGGTSTPVQNTNPDSCITVLLEDVELQLDSGVTKAICAVPTNMIFRAVSLRIGGGVFVFGESGSQIELIQKPTIRGTWNFEEQTDGFYKAMDSYVSTSTVHATHCDARILKELRVDGYIKVKERATAPNSVTGFGMFWVDDASPNTPMFTDDTGTTHNLLSGSGGGGSTLTFKTIAVAGQSDVVADSTTDTLTLAAGSNMTITTNASTDTITFASASSAGITIQDEGVALSTAATTLNFVGAGVIASGTGATKTITIAGGGGGVSGGYPLFKHDQNPTTNNFSPFRLLVDGDTIELGVSSGGTDNSDVSVFTPINDENNPIVVDIVDIGSHATNTGREYMFFGQDSRAGITEYQTFNGGSANTPIPIFFVESMRDVSGGIFGFMGSTRLRIYPSTRDTRLNNVRVMDAGKHEVLLMGDFPIDPENPDPDPSEPVPVRILLIVDGQKLFERGRFIMNNYELRS